MRLWYCASEGATRKGGCVLFKGEAAGVGQHEGCGWKQLVPEDALVIEKVDGEWPKDRIKVAGEAWWAASVFSAKHLAGRYILDTLAADQVGEPG